MYRKNPMRPARLVSDFPASPREGDLVQVEGVGLFSARADGTWAGADGSTWVAEAGAGVLARRAVVKIDGVAVLCDRSLHARLDGVVVAIVGSRAVVREAGTVEGFEDLTPGAKLFVGPEPGSIVEGPLGAPPFRVLAVGFASDAGTVVVRLFEPRGV